MPGLSAKVTVEGPVNAPTFVGLSLTYKEQGPKGKALGRPTKEEIAADDRAAQRAAATELFKPQAQKDQEKADEQAAHRAPPRRAAEAVRHQSTLIPLKPGDKPKTVDVPEAEPAEDEPKEKEEAPVQREPATADRPTAPVARHQRRRRRGPRRRSAARLGDPPVDGGAVRLRLLLGPDPRRRGRRERRRRRVGAPRSRSARTSSSGPTATTRRRPTAGTCSRTSSRTSSSSAAPDGGPGERLQRRSFFESIGILLGLAEGTWTDRELRAYLDAITSSGKIDGSYDADNKARAIVRRSGSRLRRAGTCSVRRRRC